MAMFNPSDTNVCIDAYIPRGDIIISPPAKSKFPVENHVLSPWGEILHKFSFILMYSTYFWLNFSQLSNFIEKSAKFGIFQKNESYSSYIHQKNAKMIQKLIPR